METLNFEKLDSLFFEWSKAKNERLKTDRKVSFEMVENLIFNDEVINIVPVRNQIKYPGQRCFLVKLNHYIHYVPFEVRGENIRLITIVPDRKFNKIYNS